MPHQADGGGTDILEGRAGRPRRGMGVLALVIGVVVIGLVAYAVGHHPRSRSPMGAGAPASSTPPGWPTGPAPPPGLGPLIAPVRPPVLIDPQRRGSRSIAGIPGTAEWRYTVTDLGGRYVVTARPPEAAVTSDHPTSAFLVDGDLTHATPIATGVAVTPGGDRQSVLVTVNEAASGSPVRRFDLSGRPQELTTLPAGRNLAYEAADGMLLATPDGGWELWDSKADVVRQRFSQVFTATGDAIAYGSYNHTVTITGTTRPDPLTIGFPDATYDIYGAILSPDGRFLGVHMTNQDQTRHAVAVLDIRAGQWSTMPGSPFASPNSIALTWSHDTLVLARTTDRPAVTLWLPGTPALYSAQL